MDKFREASGALMYHAKQITKGIRTAEHLRRAKVRLLQLEKLIKTDELPADEKELKMLITDATLTCYEQLPVGVFWGLNLTKDVRFLTGRKDVYADTVMHCLRDARQRGDIEYESIEAKQYSKYRKIR